MVTTRGMGREPAHKDPQTVGVVDSPTIDLAGGTPLTGEKSGETVSLPDTEPCHEYDENDVRLGSEPAYTATQREARISPAVSGALLHPVLDVFGAQLTSGANRLALHSVNKLGPLDRGPGIGLPRGEVRLGDAQESQDDVELPRLDGISHGEEISELSNNGNGQHHQPTLPTYLPASELTPGTAQHDTWSTDDEWLLGGSSDSDDEERVRTNPVDLAVLTDATRQGLIAPTRRCECQMFDAREVCRRKHPGACPIVAPATPPRRNSGTPDDSSPETPNAPKMYKFMVFQDCEGSVLSEESPSCLKNHRRGRGSWAEYGESRSVLLDTKQA